VNRDPVWQHPGDYEAAIDAYVARQAAALGVPPHLVARPDGVQFDALGTAGRKSERVDFDALNRAAAKEMERRQAVAYGDALARAEHVFVVEERLYTGRTEPDDVLQSFVHASGPTGPIHSIKYEELVRDVKLDFTVISDWDFTDRQWATIWLCGERQGLGASRSQGYGVYEVTCWDRLT
jgi:hypothetical protein